MGTRDVDEGDDRQPEPLGELHRPHRLAVALGVGHAEVAPDVLVRVGALLLADDDDPTPVEARQADDHRRVIAEQAVAVELDEVVGDAVDELERPRPPQVARKLDPRPHRVAGIGQRFAFNTSTTAAMGAVPASHSGSAAGVLNAARQLGSILGIAGAGAVFQTLESRGLLAAAARDHTEVDAQQIALIRALYTGSSSARTTLADLAPSIHKELEGIMTAVFEASFRGAMLACAIVSAAGVIVALRARPAR